MTQPLRAIDGERVEVREPAGVKATLFEWPDPAEIPTRQWLYGRHPIRRFVSATVAAGGVGKTNLIQAEACGYCVGRDLLSGTAIASGNVWYIGLEDPREEYTPRLAAIALHYEIQPTPARSLWTPDGSRISSSRGRHAPASRSPSPLSSSIIANVRDNEIDQIIVDPFIGCHAIPESDNGRIAAVVAEWGRIAEATNCAVELVHHIRKGNGTAELTADDARGASALVGAARSVRLLHPMSRDEAERAGVEERRRYFRVSFGKANLTLPPEIAIWRELVSVNLRNGDGGQDDLVGVATAWAWPNPFDDVTVAHLREVQRRLSEGDYRADIRAEDWAGKMVAEVLGWDASDRSSSNDLRLILDKWRTTGAVRIITRADGRRKPKEYLVKGDTI